MGGEMMIRFSVVVPVYNAADTIVSTIKSVLAQSYPPFEVIVVNDSSNDQTEELLRTHFTGQVIYIALPENRGPSHARNTGIDRASGTHIALQDADDVWHKDKLKIVAETLEKNSAVRFLFHDFTDKTFFPEVIQSVAGPVKLPFARLLVRNVIATPCAVFERSVMPRFDEGMHYTEDYDLFLRVAYRTGVYYLPVTLTRLNRPVLSAGGQSSNRWKMRKGEWQSYLHLTRLHPLFILLVPFLMGWSLLKHFLKTLGL